VRPEPASKAALDARREEDSLEKRREFQGTGKRGGGCFLLGKGGGPPPESSSVRSTKEVGRKKKRWPRRSTRSTGASMGTKSDLEEHKSQK